MVGTAETPTPERNQTLMVGCDHYKQEFRPKKLYDKKYCKHSSFLDGLFMWLLYIYLICFYFLICVFIRSGCSKES